MDEDHRYVGIRCPICGDRSPTVDQRQDVHRNTMNEWWRQHVRVHVPDPIIEVRRPVPMAGVYAVGGTTL